MSEFSELDCIRAFSAPKGGDDRIEKLNVCEISSAIVLIIIQISISAFVYYSFFKGDNFRSSL